MNTLIGLLFVIVGIGFLIAFHELGHFLAAKLCGVQVLEYAIGFGPRILSRVVGNTRISLKAVPFGGSCNMLGETDMQAILKTSGFKDMGDYIDADGVKVVKSEIESRSFKSKSPFKRFIIAAAGCFNNALLAVIFSLIFALNMGINVPVVSDGPFKGETLVKVSGKNVYTTLDTVVFSVGDRKKGETTITLLKDEKTHDETVALTEDGVIQYEITGEKVWAENIGDVLRYGYYYLRYTTLSATESLKMLVTGNVKSGELSGIGGMTGSLGTSAGAVLKDKGVKRMLLIFCIVFASISMNLCIMNLLPIPALDGSLLVTSFLEFFGLVVPEKVMAKAQYYGMLCLLCLMAFLMANDLWNGVTSLLKSL